MIDKLGLDGLGGASVRVEPTPQEQKVTPPVDGQSKSAFTPSDGDTPAVVGLEPVHWYLENEDEYMSEKLRKEHERLNSYTFKLCKVAHPLYSAATVERLVQERDAYRSIAEGGPLDAYQSVYEQLAATIQERDEYKAVALENRDALAAMTKKADGFFDALQLAAKINAEGQAREQQLREALEICKKEMPGDKWDSLYIDGVLAFPQDDTALNTLLAAGQAREQQLREALSAITGKALALSQDDTALREWGAKLLRDVGDKLILKAVGATNIPMLTGSVRDYLRRKADELEAGK